LVVASVIYLLSAKTGALPQVLTLAVAVLLIYRRIRDQPRRLSELFARKVARLPEVRLIVCVERKVTVGVDRSAAQLYGRINAQLNQCNRRLFFGQPMSVVIRDDLSPDETRRLLAGVGVQYVRDDAIQPR
jgi:hypothetical protein